MWKGSNLNVYFQRNWKFTHINEQECKVKENVFLFLFFLNVPDCYMHHTHVCAHASINNELNELSHNVNCLVMCWVNPVILVYWINPG